MDRLWSRLGILFICVAPFIYGPVIYYDVTHPERWCDWRHDPRWYLPALGIVGALCLVFLAYVYLTERRNRR